MHPICLYRAVSSNRPLLKLLVLLFSAPWLISVSACAEEQASTIAAELATDVEWRYLGSDSEHTRYSPAANITAENFEDLEEAWVWDGASFNAQSGRSTPSYINGVVYTVAGPRRHIVAMDPSTGETLWSYREPNTARYEYSMRKDYGKGVTYAEVDGKGVIYMTSPAFFLIALDAETGLAL